MNYYKIYKNIIDKAKLANRIRLKKSAIDYIYYENHHIVPKCMNGNEDSNNKVLLTAKEHFLCHKLLTYIHPNNRKLSYAFFYMTCNKRYGKLISARNYAYAKELYASFSVPISVRKKISKALKGIDHKGEKNTMFGKHHSDKSKLQLSKTRKEKKMWSWRKKFNV